MIVESQILKTLREKAAAQVRKRGPECSVCVLPLDTLEAIRTLRAEGFTYPVLATTVKDIGLNLNGATIGRHFREHEQRNR